MFLCVVMGTSISPHDNSQKHQSLPVDKGEKCIN